MNAYHIRFTRSANEPEYEGVFLATTETGAINKLREQEPFGFHYRPSQIKLIEERITSAYHIRFIKNEQEQEDVFIAENPIELVKKLDKLEPYDLKSIKPIKEFVIFCR